MDIQTNFILSDKLLESVLGGKLTFTWNLVWKEGTTPTEKVIAYTGLGTFFVCSALMMSFGFFAQWHSSHRLNSAIQKLRDSTKVFNEATTLYKKAKVIQDELRLAQLEAKEKFDSVEEQVECAKLREESEKRIKAKTLEAHSTLLV